MGVLSKAWKGVKKAFKKIGRGIKKVAKKVGKVLGKIAKPFQKLGIVGQLALGFLMPWAIGSTFSYLTGNAFSSVIAGLTGPGANIFQKAVGYTFQGVQMAANGLKTAYTSVTGAIDGAFTKLGEKVGDVGNWLKGNVENDPMKITDTVVKEGIDTGAIIDKSLGVDKPAAISDIVEGVTDVSQFKPGQAAVSDQVKDLTFGESIMTAIRKLPGEARKAIADSPAKIMERIQSGTLGMVEESIFGGDENAYGYSRPYVADFSDVYEPATLSKVESVYNSQGAYWNTPAYSQQANQTFYNMPVGSQWQQWFNTFLPSR